jgi:hypothetical protein
VACSKYHVGEVARDGVRGLAVTEGGSEDHVRALQDHLRDDALGIRAFGHAFGVDGFDGVAIGLFDRKPTLIVGPGPTVVADGADIDKADRKRIVLRTRAACNEACGQRCGSQCSSCEFHGVLSSVLDVFWVLGRSPSKTGGVAPPVRLFKSEAVIRPAGTATMPMPTISTRPVKMRPPVVIG